MCGELPHVALPFLRMLPPWAPWPLPRKLLKLGAGASAAPGARLRDEAAPFSEALLQFASQESQQREVQDFPAPISNKCSGKDSYSLVICDLVPKLPFQKW